MLRILAILDTTRICLGTVSLWYTWFTSVWLCCLKCLVLCGCKVLIFNNKLSYSWSSSWRKSSRWHRCPLSWHDRLLDFLTSTFVSTAERASLSAAGKKQHFGVFNVLFYYYPFEVEMCCSKYGPRRRRSCSVSVRFVSVLVQFETLYMTVNVL